jgi:hypothetical protein
MPKTSTTKEFIEKVKLIHGDRYDYSLTEYVNWNIKVKIVCKIHGVFEQIPNKHLSKKGCAKCGFISRCNIARSNSSEFINKAINVHGIKYNYDDVKYSGKEGKVVIKCGKHGTFEQTPHNHLAGNGCPRCKESKGETQIKEFLVKNSIEHIRQKRFKECRHILPLPFDFYLPKSNLCIEYQGLQHFKVIKKFGGEPEFKKRLLRDEIKRNYCRNNSINLITITYKDKINDMLLNTKIFE